MTSTGDRSKYALYVFGTNRHHASMGDCRAPMIVIKNSPSDKDSYETKSSDSDESNICLSLLETNLGAEQETVVRCYLLKTLSFKEAVTFENEGKPVVLKLSGDPKQDFGCYYHLLSKYSSNSGEINDKNSLSPHKKHMFVICLIGKADGVIESFCCELGAFCSSVLPLLDPEGVNKKSVTGKLENWFFYCIRYIERCFQFFREDIAVLLQSALCGKIRIKCSDESMLWDLERLVDACTLTDVFVTHDANLGNSNHALSSSDPDQKVENCNIVIEVVDGKITSNVPLTNSRYCERWLDKLQSCKSSDFIYMRSLLGNFRLKTIQDLNTLKRLLRRAENDHYSLFEANQFLENSGYQDILLNHVRHEATLACSKDSLEIINFLADYSRSKTPIV